ncbi:MAG: TetR/AcrR family transcriptional regulator [Steroidobacteraceae bacterium]
MTTKTPAVPEKTSARERLLAAAAELFYMEGINTVGIDRVIERAGVAKASLYNTFGSKDELIQAYLTAKHEAREQRVQKRLSGLASAREKILAVFDDQCEVARKKDFRGCAFIRASAELGAENGIRGVCDASRGWLRGLFKDLATQGGARDPATLARQLELLYEGAAVSWQPDAAGSASKVAREAAVCLLASGGVRTSG